MLDQNTDRMWYVIGAVLVGAAIILIANGTLPQMFASVTGSFEEVSNEALVGISEVHSYVNDLEGNMISKYGIIYDKYWNPKTHMLSDAGHGRDYAVPASISVVEGETYVFATPNMTYKYMQFYDANGEPLYDLKDDFEIGLPIMERTAPDNAQYVRISSRYNYTFDPSGSEGGSPEHIAPIETWWFGTAKDFENIDM